MAPRRLHSGWEMVYPAGSTYRVRADSVLRVELPRLDPVNEGDLVLRAGAVSAMAMWSCEMFPLHAVGLHLPESVVAVFAPPGGGKSTLAAVALGNGARVQGDDLLGLSREGEIVSRAGSLRIEPAMAPAGFHPEFDLADGRGWYALPSPGRAQLGALLSLRRGASTSLTAVRGHRRLSHLLSAGFLSRFDPEVPPRWEEGLLDFCARLPMWELQVPDGLADLRSAWPDIHSLLKQAVEGGAG